MIALLFTLGSSAAIAQPAYRDLTGTVTDRQHEPLRGAVVQIENEETKSVVSYITNRTGQYNFKRLDDKADYRLWATWRDQRSSVKKLTQFDANRDKVIDLVIEEHER
jgi:hypothetical protein